MPSPAAPLTFRIVCTACWKCSGSNLPRDSQDRFVVCPPVVSTSSPMLVLKEITMHGPAELVGPSSTRPAGSCNISPSALTVST